MADLEPSEFLQNIRELGEKREREDEERVRRLEAQILQDKSEREARRAGWCSWTRLAHSPSCFVLS